MPVIFHLFAHSVPVEERSRAFGYLVAAGSVGQVVASVVSLLLYNFLHVIVIVTPIQIEHFQLCPHLSWQAGFYLFGTIGIAWTLLWLVLYHETNSQDEIPLFVPKVSICFS